MVFNPHDILHLQQLVSTAERIVLVCHVSPDGDAMGSTLGLMHLLEAMGKRPAVITPDVPTSTLDFLPGSEKVIHASRQTQKAKVHFDAADLVICLDFNVPDRIDRIAEMMLGSAAPKVLIDHHLHPDSFAQLTFSYPDSSSTCYLLYSLICAAGWRGFLNGDSATCLYTGMMTDTGNFSYNSNCPGLYTAIADLLSLGIDKDRIYTLGINTMSLDSLRLNAYAVSEKMQVFSSHRCAVISLDAGELKRFNYQKGDTEGLVNKPLSVPEIIYSVFVREDENQIKFSLRSKGEFPVNKICKDHLGGGGHLNAAGGELHCSLDQALRLLYDILPQYDKYLPDNE